MSHFVYTASHTIYYNTKEPVPISEVIAGLQGLQGILRNVEKVVEGLTDSDISRSEFFIERIESGSLIEKIVVKFFFASDEELDKFLDKIRENGVLRNTIVGVAIGGLITYGAMYAVGAGKGVAPNITANNNVIINIGAGEVKMTPEAFQSIVATAIGDKQENAKDVIKFMSPARRDPNASVQIQSDGADPISITPQAIAETPKKPVPRKNQREELIEKATVQLRASDLDSKKTGWAGQIDGVTNRVKINLDPTVSERDLFGRKTVTADVTVLHTLKPGTNSYSPSQIYINRIYPGQ